MGGTEVRRLAQSPAVMRMAIKDLSHGDTKLRSHKHHYQPSKAPTQVD